MGNGASGAASSGGLASLLSNQTFLYGAFIVAIVLLIMAHKITVEGMIEA
jgi:hypothetical protein